MIIDFTASIVTSGGVRARIENARADYSPECGGYFDYLLGKSEKSFSESACGFLLLDSLLVKYGIDRANLTVSVDEKGRPQIMHDDIDFSVSHSDGCAMCAVALGEDARVRCDLRCADAEIIEREKFSEIIQEGIITAVGKRYYYAIF